MSKISATALVSWIFVLHSFVQCSLIRGSPGIESALFVSETIGKAAHFRNSHCRDMEMTFLNNESSQGEEPMSFGRNCAGFKLVVCTKSLILQVARGKLSPKQLYLAAKTYNKDLEQYEHLCM